MEDMTAKDHVFMDLTGAGWVQDGYTSTMTVRVPTNKSPLTNGGKGGGEVRTFGGRFRMRRGNWRVTIGNRTVCFYPAKGFDGSFQNFQTSNRAGIMACEKTLK